MADVKVALDELKEDLDSGKLSGVVDTRPGRRKKRLAWAGGFIVLIVIAAAGAWLRFVGRASNPELAQRTVPLTSYPGYERCPSFSPDGNQVAFVWNGPKQDNDDIYIKLVGTENALRLTSDPAADKSPAWSPDGRSIAFLRYLPGGKAAVLLIPALGGPERKLTEVLRARYMPGSGLAWSPDGNWLAMAIRASSTEPSALFLLSIESGELRRLTSPSANPNAGDCDPAFSPDGGALVFSRSADAQVADLYLLALSRDLKPSGEPKRLTFNNRGNGTPAWTADGQDIVYSSSVASSTSSSAGTSTNLWRIAVSGSGKPQPLVGLDGDQPAISRDGRHLVFARYVSNADIWRLELPGPRAKAIPQRPAGAPFIASTYDDGMPQFSPDGKRVAFVSSRTGYPEIWVCDSDGSNDVQLTSFGGASSTTPRWSPDGERIAFDSSREGQFDIYTIGASGGKPQRLTSDPANDGNPSWSHDGQWIYFDSARTGKAEVWKVPAKGDEPVQLTKKGGFGPLESPDGKILYFTKSLSGTKLWRVPVDGGEEVRVLDSVSAFANVALVPTGIYFIPNADWSIQFFDLATGTTTPIATIGQPEWGLTVSPDERWILYTQVDQEGSDLMLVENFR